VILGLGAASGVLGFLLGLFCFKVKSRWCPDCGAWTHKRRPIAPRLSAGTGSTPTTYWRPSTSSWASRQLDHLSSDTAGLRRTEVR
jgi:hypothetical protein